MSNQSNIIRFPNTGKEILNGADNFDQVVKLVLGNKFEEARDILYRILETGNNDAYIYLGGVHSLEPKKNPILDYERAYFYYSKSIEITGSSEAHIAVAHMFRLGNIGEEDNRSALNIYLDLISQGIYADGFLPWITGAMHALGVGTPQDLETAEYYLRKGWKLKHLPSLNTLGDVMFKKHHYLKGFVFKVYSTVLSFFYAFTDEHSPRIRIT